MQNKTECCPITGSLFRPREDIHNETDWCLFFKPQRLEPAVIGFELGPDPDLIDSTNSTPSSLPPLTSINTELTLWDELYSYGSPLPVAVKSPTRSKQISPRSVFSVIEQTAMDISSPIESLINKATQMMSKYTSPSPGPTAQGIPVVVAIEIEKESSHGSKYDNSYHFKGVDGTAKSLVATFNWENLFSTENLLTWTITIAFMILCSTRFHNSDVDEKYFESNESATEVICFEESLLNAAVSVVEEASNNFKEILAFGFSENELEEVLLSY
jgi:hypothetical protein